MNMTLGKVRYGETFSVFKNEFVVLDHIAGGVFCIKKDVWVKAAFDEDGINDFSEADAWEFTEMFRYDLGICGAKKDDFIPMFVNLKATDGARTYGLYQGDTGLLTLTEYGKYRRIIPSVDEAWWLATPFAANEKDTPDYANSDMVWYVDKTCGFYHGSACNELCFRPTVMFTPDLVVNLVDS